MAQPCDTLRLCLYQLAASLRWLTKAPFSLLLPRRASQAVGSAPHDAHWGHLGDYEGSVLIGSLLSLG